MVFAAFFSFTIGTVFSQTDDRFDINFDSFEYTTEYKEKIKIYKDSYSIYKKTIDQNIADELQKEIEKLVEQEKPKKVIEWQKKKDEEFQSRIDDFIETVKIHSKDHINYQRFLSEKTKQLETLYEDHKNTIEKQLKTNFEAYEHELRNELRKEYENQKDKDVNAEKENLEKTYKQQKNKDVNDLSIKLQKQKDKEFQSRIDEFIRIAQNIPLRAKLAEFFHNVKNDGFTDYQTFLSEKTKELEKLYEDQKNTIEKQLNDSYNANLEAYKHELRNELEEKKKTEISELEKELKESYERQKNIEVNNLSIKLQEQKVQDFNSRIDEFINIAKIYPDEFTDYQTFLSEKTTELENLYDLQKNTIEKQLNDSYNAKIEVYKQEDREGLIKEFEEKKNKEISIEKENLKKEYDELNKQQKKIIEEYEKKLQNEYKEKESLKKEYEELAEQQKKKIEEYEKKFQKEYDEKENLKKEYDELNKQQKNAYQQLESEYQQKLVEYKNEVTPRLREDAYVETKAATARIKTVSLYTFVVIILIICIVTIMKIMANKREKQEKIKQEDAELKLLIEKFFEYLKASKGDKSSCIDYFNEHYQGQDYNKALEYKAYQEAVKKYENPTIALEEGE